MIGLDTSVLVRLLLGQPADQAAAARRLLEEAIAAGEPVIASDLVVAEAYYALRHHYGVPDDVARAQLAALLDSGLLETDPPKLSRATRAPPPPGLVDRLIQSRYSQLGAVTRTFDKALARTEHCLLVR